MGYYDDYSLDRRYEWRREEFRREDLQRKDGDMWDRIPDRSKEKGRELMIRHDVCTSQINI